MGRSKYSIEIVEEMFKERNYTLISEEYKNTDTNLFYTCKIHPDKIQSIKLYNFNIGKGCKYCANEISAKKRKHSIDYVRKTFEEKGYTLLETEYISNATKMRYICSKHSDKENKITFRSLISGSGCRYCGNESIRKSRKTEFEIVSETFEKAEFILLESSFKDSHTKMKCKCKKHENEIQYISYKSVKDCTTPCNLCWREKLSNMYSRENHWMWNGGNTPKNRIDRSSSKNQSWRKSVFERDNYTCKCCNKRGGIILNAHHILNFHNHMELRFDINNGITLCEECHNKFHKEYGNRNNNREQLRAFISRREAL